MGRGTMADPLPSGGPAMVRVVSLADYHNLGPRLRAFRKVEFKQLPTSSKGSGNSVIAAAVGYRGARHMGQSVGPSSGSTISPVTTNPNRS